VSDVTHFCTHNNVDLKKLCHGWSTALNCVQQWGQYSGPLFVALTAVHASHAIH